MNMASSFTHQLSFPGAFMNPFPPGSDEPGTYCTEGRMQVDQAATTLTMLALGSSYSCSSSSSSISPSSGYTVEDRSARPSTFSNSSSGGSYYYLDGTTTTTTTTTPNLPSIAELGLAQLLPFAPERRSSVASVASSACSSSSLSSLASGYSTASSTTAASDTAISRSSSVSAISSILSPTPSSPTRPASPAWHTPPHTLLPHPPSRHAGDDVVRRRGAAGGGGGGVRKPGSGGGAAKTTNRNNQKYPDSHVDFVLYGRCTRNLAWAPLTAEYEQWQRRVAAAGRGGGSGSGSGSGTRLPSRTPSGLQARYYRQRLVVPIVDADGGITFDAAGKQQFREQKVRDDKCIDIKVDLVHMFPERVVYYAYDFVTPHEMDRAKRLTTLRNFQRRERGLPEWQPEADQQRRRTRNPSRRDMSSLL